MLLAEVGHEALLRSGRHLKLHSAFDKNSINHGSTVFAHRKSIPKEKLISLLI
jgi:hypothetical protein